MAESVVCFLLDKLVALAEQEVELLKDVQNEIDKMKSEFQSIKAFLRDADGKVDIDQGVKEWVEQVRDVAYDIEDVLDDYLFSHHTKQFNNHGGEIQGSCIGSNAGIFKRVTCFFKRLKSQHEIGTQIQDIRVNIQEISNRRRRYNIDSSVEQGSTFFGVKSRAMRDPREDALFLEEFQLVGIEKNREKLVGYLSETETRLGVVAVFGQGGLGKTTLVKKVYDSPRVKGQFPYRAWITVSETYDARGLLRSLMKQLFGIYEGAETAIELKQLLNDNLRQKRYVIVLDDIWKLDAWRDLKNAFPNDNASGSRIIVTTRFKNIAHTCVKEYGHIYPLQPLDSEDSWKLFYKKAFNSNVVDMIFFSEQVLRDRSEKFLRKCNGLPLAIVAIGGLLSMKQHNEWEQVYQNLGSLIDGSTNGSQSQLEDLYFVISLSYNDLPYQLKSCFLYMCIFPEDCPIDCSRLLRLWVGEGFVTRGQSVDMTMEDVASLYLDELIQRSLVQVTETNERSKVKTCGLHDLMREFITTKARNQNLATTITEKQEVSQYFPSDDSTRRRRPRLLSISCLEDQDNGTIILSENNTSYFHVRSLFVFTIYGSWISRSSSTTLFTSFRLLRVLDLKDADLREFPIQVLNLLYLRYLSLRANKRVSYVPTLVGKLVHLETLDLKCTGTKELPAGILKLRRLRNLFAFDHNGGDSIGVKLPVGIHRLATLEKLEWVNADEKGSGLLVKELGMLTQLRRLSIYNLREENSMQLFASVQKMKYLRSFKVLLKPGMFLHSRNLSSPSSCLRCLHIEGVLDRIPGWILSLQNLEEIQLVCSGLKSDPVEVLQGLPNLVILRLLNWSFDGEELRFAKGGFPRLKTLHLMMLENLNKVEIEEESMPVIRGVNFNECNKLKFPLGLKNLTTLDEIVSTDMSPQFVDRLVEHCWKPGHLPRLVIHEMDRGLY